VIPVLSYTTEEEAVERANGSRFGLGGSVWSADAAYAARLAGQLECGTAWVNQHMSGAPGAPFGGFKESGIGREGGLAGVLEFTETQTVAIKK
jgi:acyl-CoA reductase-like NAD-dependent aldehyde dehydrogenase